jgi:hypothetical protein
MTEMGRLRRLLRLENGFAAWRGHPRLAGLRPPIGPAGRRRYNYFAGGGVAEAETLVISARLLCASAMSEG